MKDFGLVSIVMPAYNAEAFISEAIESVLAQSYPNWELVIVNDGSSDQTEKLIQKFSEDKRIRYFPLSGNLGTQNARNKAIENAQGDFIAFLDADDLWKPEKLSIQLHYLQKNNLNACFSSYELIDENGKSLNKIIEALPVLSFKKLLRANYVGNLTGIYNSRILGKIKSPDLQKRQDWALWLEVIEKGGAIHGIAEPLAYYRMRKGSISTNKIEMLKYNFMVYHKILNYSFLKSCIMMLGFLKEQLIVKPRQTKNL